MLIWGARHKIQCQMRHTLVFSCDCTDQQRKDYRDIWGCAWGKTAPHGCVQTEQGQYHCPVAGRVLHRVVGAPKALWDILHLAPSKHLIASCHDLCIWNKEQIVVHTDQWSQNSRCFSVGFPGQFNRSFFRNLAITSDFLSWWKQ